MTARDEAPALYLSTPHDCSYLDDRVATTLLIDPNFCVDEPLSSVLIKQGFRRSGSLYYRPHCEKCSACISLRVPAEKFQPNRSQRRTWRRNQDLNVRLFRTRYSPEHFKLYRQYQSHRHPGSTMDDDNQEKYIEFLVNSRIDTRILELREKKRLLAAAVVDVLDNGLSAIYTFFDPAHCRRSLGTFAILWLIEHAKLMNLDWVYLGYWIAECDKMRYKNQFKPAYGFIKGSWRPLSAETKLSADL